MAESETSPSFGRVLRRARQAAGLTQEELAERAHLSWRTISDLERGLRLTPRRETVALLADALDLGETERAALEAAGRRRGARPHGPPHLAVSAAPPLVGRTHELEVLERHLVGEGPPALLLAGEPGIGKTRLLHETAARALHLGWTVLEGGCERRWGQDPYAPLTGALQRHIRGRQPAALRAELQGCAWLVRLLPELADGPIPPLPPWLLSAEQERRLMGEAVIRFLGNVTGTAGTLLLLDDLHWADPDALDLLAAIVRRAAEIPLRILGTYREVEIQAQDPLATLLADLSRARLAAQRAIGPLAAEEATQLLDVLLPGTESELQVLRTQLVQRTGGVPFFLVSCTQELRPGEGSSRGENGVPWDVAQSVRQRVAVLPEAACALLGVAAVMGRTAPRSLLTTMLARPEAEMLAAFDAVVRARLLDEVGPEEYQFAHDLIREVIEADLGSARRAVLHRRVAEALEHGPTVPSVDALAYHYARGDAQDKALYYLEAAGDRAQAQYAHIAAADHYRETVERLDRLGRRLDGARAREKLGVVLTTMAQYDAALEALEQAAATLRATGDMEGLGRVLACIGRVYATRARAHDLELGVARLLPLREKLEARDPSRALAQLCLALSALYCKEGQLQERLAEASRAVEITRTLNDSGLLAEAEAEIAAALASLGRDTEALPLLRAAGARAEAAGSLGGLCTILLYTAWVYEERGEFGLGQGCALRALATAERLGDPNMIRDAQIRLAALAFFSGDWGQTRSYLEGQTPLQECDAVHRAAPLLEWGRLALAEGAWARAAPYLQECSALASQAGVLVLERVAQSYLAERDLLEGRPEVALARLPPLLDRGDAQEHVVTTYVLPVLAWAYLELGNTEQAAQVITQAVSRARAASYRLTLVDALRVQAMVARRQGRWEEATQALEDGVALARNISYPYGEGRLLHVCGEMYVARDEPEAARERLEEALAIFQRLGARKDAEIIQQELARVALLG
jgi:tetratricopeptide (TPR) repeat protein/transcriptional regulator with XRE-family HTH domain